MISVDLCSRVYSRIEQECVLVKEGTLQKESKQNWTTLKFLKKVPPKTEEEQTWSREEQLGKLLMGKKHTAHNITLKTIPGTNQY